MMKKTKKSIFRLVWVMLVVFWAVGPVQSAFAGPYNGGNGSAEKPYRISTPQNMNEIGTNPWDLDKHFVLTNNIDLSGYIGTQFNIIGIDYDNAFIGVFDGNDHTIFNFTYTTTDTSDIGLFGYVKGAIAVIKDLTLVAPNVNAAGDLENVASLVGCLSGTITGCGVEGGSVSGGNYGTGGLVGYLAGGTITNCYATGSVSGRAWTGGLVGYLDGDNDYGTITNCYATGIVSGTSNCTGGLVGYNFGGTISNCYAAGSVSGGDYFTGGLAGVNQKNAVITKCYSTSDVSGGGCVGGLVGYHYEATISNCYATGSVTGGSNTGGLVGYNLGSTTTSASFWDIETGGPDNGIGTPLPTSQMQTETAFTGAGWDFVGEQVNGGEDIWRMCVDGLDYPMFWWEFIDGDFVCPDGVEINDLDVLVQQWLMEKLSADVAPSSGDGVVDFADWAVLADGWQNTTDINHVAVFAGQWLRFGAYCADIAPLPGGDGMVDMLDFAVLAEHWLMGK